MRKILIGAAAALMVTGCQSNAYGNSIRETAAVSQNVIAITSEPSIAMTDMDDTVSVTGNQVNIRAGASAGTQILGSVNCGDTLKRTGYGVSWSRVLYNGKEAFISNSYITADSAPQESSGQNQDSTGNQTVSLNPSWKYAEFSKISSGTAQLYRSQAADRKNKVICVNAGHGTNGGGSVKTQCHPDGSAKVTGGTTQAGATTAVAVSSGMTFSDGTPEAKVTLAMAKKLKEKLLAAGYDVLMIRESDDVQLDNIARTVIANNMADCHIALHWDSTEKDKGAFYMSVPSAASYRSMEPVASNWQKHNALGESLVAGLKSAGVKIFSSGSMEMDLTQTSFSTVPSIDIELGDKKSDHSDSTLEQLADGLLAGVNQYFQ